MGTKVKLITVSGKEYEVILQAYRNDMQGIVDEVFSDELYIMNMPDGKTKLINTHNIESIEY